MSCVRYSAVACGTWPSGSDGIVTSAHNRFGYTTTTPRKVPRPHDLFRWWNFYPPNPCSFTHSLNHRKPLPAQHVAHNSFRRYKGAHHRTFHQLNSGTLSSKPIRNAYHNDYGYSCVYTPSRKSTTNTAGASPRSWLLPNRALPGPQPPKSLPPARTEIVSLRTNSGTRPPRLQSPLLCRAKRTGSNGLSSTSASHSRTKFSSPSPFSVFSEIFGNLN